MSLYKPSLVTVSVTQEHIEQGKKFEEDCCPVALALVEELSPDVVKVMRHNVWIYCRGKQFAAAISETPQSWILDFDYGKPVEPFIMELDFVDGFGNQLRLKKRDT